jgi:hypothetical protein
MLLAERLIAAAAVFVAAHSGRRSWCADMLIRLAQR